MPMYKKCQGKSGSDERDDAHRYRDASTLCGALMKCNRCHKEIKNPKSVQHGYGPICWVKVQKSHAEAEEKKRKESHSHTLNNWTVL